MAKRGMAALRLVAVSAFGMAMAAAVCVGLTGLLRGGGDQPIEAAEAHKIRFTRLIHDTTLVPKDRSDRPEPPKLVRTVLIPIPQPSPGTGVSPVQRTALGRPALERGDPTFGSSVSGRDTDLIPVVRVLPEYPPHGRGNGSVLIQFDVSVAGTVVNARVIESTLPGMFAQAALQAISRWRYRPAVFDGQPVERRGVQVRLRFELERA